MKIYIVTDGSYSDYHIAAVFTDRKKAEIYAAVHEFDCVEEFEADEPQIDGDTKIWYVHKFFTNGETIIPEEITYSTEKISKLNAGYSWFSRKEVVTIYVSLEEKNESKAEKIAQDVYAQYRAEKIGL